MSTRRDWTVILVSVTAVALTAVIGAVSLHESCFDPIAGRPSEGTPRAGYCDAVNPTHPWLSLVVLPILVMLVVNVGFNGRKRLVYLVAAILAVALVVNAAVVSGMTSQPSF